MQVQPGSWRIRAHALADTLLNFLFPPVCANCRKVGTLLCAECRAEFSWLAEPLCAACGRPLPEPEAPCAFCAQRPLPLKQVRTAVFFQEPMQSLIHKFKYENNFGLGGVLGDVMVQAWPDWQPPIDCIVPIPLHKKRQQERGYNQSELLARQLAARMRIPLETGCLQRARHTAPQVHLSAQERQQNVAGAFTASGGNIVGRHILLIDDVLTTGATLSAAANALYAAGATAVSGYCLARAK